MTTVTRITVMMEKTDTAATRRRGCLTQQLGVSSLSVTHRKIDIVLKPTQPKAGQQVHRVHRDRTWDNRVHG